LAPVLQDPFFHLRVLHHLEQAPGQGLRRRVAPSDQEVENQIRQEFRVQTWAFCSPCREPKAIAR
jgi:hypothetical protein